MTNSVRKVGDDPRISQRPDRCAANPLYTPRYTITHMYDRGLAWAVQHNLGDRFRGWNFGGLRVCQRSELGERRVCFRFSQFS